MLAPDRHEFHVEADPDLDVLMRVLGLFAVQGAAPAEVRHLQTDEGAWMVIQAVRLEPERADLLRRRLSQVPAVRGVRVSTCLTQANAAK